MATYGIDVYGDAYYGTAATTFFNAAPFLALQPDHGVLLLRWSQPVGAYTSFRLVKNLFGYPGNETDGQFVIDIADRNVVAPPTSYYDTDVLPGRFYYYSLFVYDDSNAMWVRAGDVTGLPVEDHGYTERLVDLVPRFYRRDDPGLTNDEGTYANDGLHRFLSTFGFHLDLVRTECETLESLNDYSKVSYGNLALLAAQMGVMFEPELGPMTARARVKYASHNQRLKGTAQGIRNIINTDTGWDAAVSIGYNLMLDDDQSQFLHPTYPAWDPSTQYLVGDRVVFANATYRCIVGAYGLAQAPPSLPGSNTWWVQVSNAADTTLRNAGTGGVSTWEVVSFSTGINPAAGDLTEVVGASSPLNPASLTANVAQIRNSAATVAALGARSVAKLTGQTSLDPGQVMVDGLPVDPADQGALFTVSAYFKSPAAGRTAYVFTEWYDDHGNLIAQVLPPVIKTIYASFSSTTATTTTDTGATWGETGTWIRNGSFVYPSAAGDGVFRHMTVDAGRNNATTYATIKRFPAVGDCGVMVNYDSFTNWYRVGRTKIERSNGNVITTIAVLPTAFTDGDRMGVRISGTTLSVFRNGTQIWSGTITVVPNATQAGIWST